MAQAIATTTSTDVAMAGTSILSAVSYCFSGVYRMLAKRDHTEPLVLDTLTIAEPSFKKSPVMSLIKRPYIQFAYDWNENNKQDIFTSQAERKLLQSKLEALEKKKDVTAEEIAKLQTELSNIPPSNFRRIAVDDVTPESLVNLLEENGTLLMISDEAGMLGNFSGRYSNNVPNLDLLLKSWNGETYISDRATRASIVFKKTYAELITSLMYVKNTSLSKRIIYSTHLSRKNINCFRYSCLLIIPVQLYICYLLGKRSFKTPCLIKIVLFSHDHNILRHSSLNSKALGITTFVLFCIVISGRDNSNRLYSKSILFPFFESRQLA